MSFANPAAFFWLLLAIPLIGLYILKVRMRRVETSTTMFWNQIYDEKPPRSIWETLKHLLSLLAQLFLLVLLVFALADPFLPWQVKSARRTVLVIDPSASMQVVHDGQTRFASAVQAATDLTHSLRHYDQMAIVLAGEHPRVVCGLSSHLPTLKRTLHELRPGDGPTELKSSIELGQRLLSDHPHGEIVIFSDGCAADQNLLKDQPHVQLQAFGKTKSNLGITQFQVRRSLVDPLGYEVLIVVRNASDVPVRCRVELELNDVPIDVLPIQLQPNETWKKSIEKTSLAGGTLIGRLTQMAIASENAEDANTASAVAIKVPPTWEDGLVLDNEATAILLPREIQNVLLVTPGNLFLQKVLEANPLVRLTVQKELPATFPGNTLVVFHRIIPKNLPSGNVWIVDPESECDFFQITGEIENPLITQQLADSPLMTHVKLENVVMPKAKKLKFNQSPQVLAGALTGETIYAELKRGNSKGLVLASNLDEGDLTFRTAFPIMVTNALGWFAGTSGEQQPAIATGSVTSLPLPDNFSEGSSLQLRSPDGKTTPVTPPRLVELQIQSDGENTQAGTATKPSVMIGPLDRVGIWTLESVSSSGEQKQGEVVEKDTTVLQSISCNLANEKESDLRPDTAITETSNVKLAGTHWWSRPLWYLLLILALLFTTWEWALYQRRVIR